MPEGGAALLASMPTMPTGPNASELCATPAPGKRSGSATEKGVNGSPTSKNFKRRRVDASPDGTGAVHVSNFRASRHNLSKDASIGCISRQDVDAYLQRYVSATDREAAARLCEAGLVLGLCTSSTSSPKCPSSNELRGMVAGTSQGDDCQQPVVVFDRAGQIMSARCSCRHELLWCSHIAGLLMAATKQPKQPSSASLRDFDSVAERVSGLSRDALESLILQSVLDCTPYTPRALSLLGFHIPEALVPPSLSRTPTPSDGDGDDDVPSAADGSPPASPQPLATVRSCEPLPRLLFDAAPLAARVARAVDACLASREHYRACSACDLSELPPSPARSDSFSVLPALPSAPRRRASIRWDQRPSSAGGRPVAACPACGAEAEERGTPARLGPLLACVAELLQAAGRLWEAGDPYGALVVLEACTDAALARWAELGPPGARLPAPSVPPALRAAAPAACCGADVEPREALLEALAATWQARVLEPGLAPAVRRRFAAPLEAWAAAGGEAFRHASVIARHGWELPALAAIVRGDKRAVREAGPALRREEEAAVLELRARHMEREGRHREALWLAKHGGLPALAARARIALGKVESAVLGALADVDRPRELLQLAALTRPASPAGALWLAARALRLARPAAAPPVSPRRAAGGEEPSQLEAARCLLDVALGELRAAVPEGADDTPLRALAGACAKQTVELAELDAFVAHATFLEPPAAGVPPSPESDWDEHSRSPASLQPAALAAQRTRGRALLGFEAAARLVARDTRAVFDLWTCACILQHVDIRLAWLAAERLVARCATEPPSFLASFATQDKLMQLIEWCTVAGEGEAGLAAMATQLAAALAGLPRGRATLAAAFRARRFPHVADRIEPPAPAPPLPAAAAPSPPQPAEAVSP